MRRPHGFSVLEGVVALLILGIAIAGLRYGATVRSHEAELHRAQIERLAMQRLRTILTDTGYASLEKRYRGVELRLAGMPGYTRTTRIRHRRDSTDAGVVDFKRVTVTVTGPTLDEPVVRSAVITSARVAEAHARVATPGS